MIAVLDYGHVEQPIELCLVLFALSSLLSDRNVLSGIALGAAVLTRTIAGFCLIPLMFAPLATRRIRPAATCPRRGRDRSAGAMVAGISRMPFPFGSGLDLLPGTAVGVHWDALSGWWIRWLRDLAPRRLPSQVSFVGIAEHTAIASDGDAWHVFGSGVVDMRRGSERHAFTAGERFPR